VSAAEGPDQQGERLILGRPLEGREVNLEVKYKF